MTRKNILNGAVAVALAASVAGCSTSHFGDIAASDINKIAVAMTSPTTVQAINNFKVGVVAAICNVASTAAFVKAATAAGVPSGDISTIDPKSTLGKIYEIETTVVTISAAECALGKGLVDGQAQVTGQTTAGVVATPVK